MVAGLVCCLSFCCASNMVEFILDAVCFVSSEFARFAVCGRTRHLLPDVNTLEWDDIRTIELGRRALLRPELPIWRKTRWMGTSTVNRECGVGRVQPWSYSRNQEPKSSTDWLLCCLHGSRYGSIFKATKHIIHKTPTLRKEIFAGINFREFSLRTFGGN